MAVILTFVQCGSEILFLTIREECKFRVFENRISRRIFEPKWNENGEWRRFHVEELRNLYRSPNIIRVIKYRILRWVGHLVKMEESMRAIKILTGKPTGKKPLGRPSRRWEGNIRMDLKGIGFQYVELG